MKLGINSYTFKWSLGVEGYGKPARQFDLYDLLDETRKHNLSLLQICDNYPLHQVSRAMRIDFAKAAADAGVTLEVGTRNSDSDNLKQYLGIAGEMGAKLVRTMPVFGGNRYVDVAHAIREIRSVVPLCEEHGICIAIENYEAASADELAEIVDGAGSRYIGVCLDTANSLGRLEPPEKTVGKLAKYAKCVHLKDFTITRAGHRSGFVVEGCPMGSGLLDLKSVFREMESCWEKPSAIIEHWVPYTGSVETAVQLEKKWLPESLRHINALIGG